MFLQLCEEQSGFCSPQIACIGIFPVSDACREICFGDTGALVR